jgi:uncharacterized protein YjiS (DUF1127 family)
MPQVLLHGSVYAQGRATARKTQRISSALSGLLETIRAWIVRSRQRRAIAELAELDDHILKDIGVSKDKMLREAAKPFWLR